MNDRDAFLHVSVHAQANATLCDPGNLPGSVDKCVLAEVRVVLRSPPRTAPTSVAQINLIVYCLRPLGNQAQQNKQALT